MQTESLPAVKRAPTENEVELGLARQVCVMARTVLRLAERLEGEHEANPLLLQRLINMASDITCDASTVIRVADRFRLLDDADSDETLEARQMVDTVAAMNRQLRRVHERS